MAQEDDSPADLTPVLYSFRRCPYAMRARMAIAVSGQRCELREVVLRDKPAELLAASPKGTVPVLVDVDGSVIAQSLDIMLWALRRNDPERWLQPDGGTLDDMLSLIAECDGEFKRNLDGYKYPGRQPGADAGLHRQQGARGGYRDLAIRASICACRPRLVRCAAMAEIACVALSEVVRANLLAGDGQGFAVARR
jgi:glutathione S-transferase